MWSPPRILSSCAATAPLFLTNDSPLLLFAARSPSRWSCPKPHKAAPVFRRLAQGRRWLPAHFQPPSPSSWREPIFDDDQDRRRFLDTLTEPCQKTAWQVHAYCLMSNHFHLAPPSRRPPWLPVDRLLGEWAIPKDSVAGRGGPATDGRTAPGGGGRGVQGDGAGLVSWRRGLPAGATGAGPHPARPEPLRGSSAGG